MHCRFLLMLIPALFITPALADCQGKTSLPVKITLTPQYGSNPFAATSNTIDWPLLNATADGNTLCINAADLTTAPVLFTAESGSGAYVYTRSTTDLLLHINQQQLTISGDIGIYAAAGLPVQSGKHWLPDCQLQTLTFDKTSTTVNGGLYQANMSADVLPLSECQGEALLYKAPLWTNAGQQTGSWQLSVSVFSSDSELPTDKQEKSWFILKPSDASSKKLMDRR